MSNEIVTLRGSCLCGRIRYEVCGPIEHVTHCHCNMCQKAHGAAFATFGRMRSKDFVLVAGAEHVISYQSSPQVKRTFCQVCASPIQFIYIGQPEMPWLAMGSLDDDPQVYGKQHIFVDSRASWFHITDELPQHEELP